MESPGRICILCRQSMRQLAPRAHSMVKPYHRWVRHSTSSLPTATFVSHSTRRIATPIHPRQEARQAQTSHKRLPWRPTPFSTSAYRPATIMNARKDEDGEEMVVEITARAADRLKQIMTKDSNPDLALRITVESGGCHGFQYLMSLTDMSKVSEEDDTVFEGHEGARIVLDEPSLELLKGSKVDYTMELIGSQFKIVDNPLATSSCGCGTSFDIKA